jgi:hypothetical protein
MSIFYTNLQDSGYHIREAIVEEDGGMLHFNLTNEKIKSIEVHNAQGDGDKWFIRVGYRTRDYVDFFNIISIDWAEGVAPWTKLS